MKSTKSKLPVPLVNGALIARREITLGLGHTALVEIRYDGPNQPAPTIGADWPPETDWPAARLTLHLPRNHGYIPHDDLQIDHHVMDGRLLYCKDGVGSQWASLYGGPNNYCSRSRRRPGSSLRTLAAEMLREVIAELRPVQAHCQARAARLAQREATLQAGLDVRPVKEASPAAA